MVRSQRRPSVTCRPRQPTRAKKDDRKALRRSGALGDQAGELVNFQEEERPAEQCGRYHPAVIHGIVAGAGADACDAASEAGQQQARRLERDAVDIKQVLPAGAARGLPGQNRVGGKERGEHDDVAEQEDPEAVSRDDPLRGKCALRVLESPAFDRRPTPIMYRSSPLAASCAMLIRRPPAERVPRGGRCGFPDRCGRPPRPKRDIRSGRATRRRRKSRRRQGRIRPPATRYAR
jgi:hypothetical protein